MLAKNKRVLSIKDFKELISTMDNPRNPDSKDPFIHPEVDPTPNKKPINDPETEPSSDPDVPKKESKDDLYIVIHLR